MWYELTMLVWYPKFLRSSGITVFPIYKPHQPLPLLTCVARLFWFDKVKGLQKCNLANACVIGKKKAFRMTHSNFLFQKNTFRCFFTLLNSNSFSPKLSVDVIENSLLPFSRRWMVSIWNWVKWIEESEIQFLKSY